METPRPEPPAVVLLSGGLDSATVLAIARERGHACHCLTVAYGQRHSAELDAAQSLAAALDAASHRVVSVDLRAIGGSALTGDIDVPKHDPASTEAPASVPHAGSSIPATYVPARNLLMLSLAAGLAEVVAARDIFIGVNAVDYSGYPDCRPDFIRAFQTAVNAGTKAGVEGRTLTVHAPLIDMTKADIIRAGAALGLDYALTHSCYDPDDSGAACGRCDSCRIRRQGFADADIPDPTRYAAQSQP